MTDRWCEAIAVPASEMCADDKFLEVGSMFNCNALNLEGTACGKPGCECEDFDYKLCAEHYAFFAKRKSNAEHDAKGLCEHGCKPKDCMWECNPAVSKRMDEIRAANELKAYRDRIGVDDKGYVIDRTKQVWPKNKPIPRFLEDDVIVDDPDSGENLPEKGNFPR